MPERITDMTIKFTKEPERAALPEELIWEQADEPEDMPPVQHSLPLRRPFAAGLSFYKLVWLFMIGSLIGYCVEMLWCFINSGAFESRKGLLYGPFTPIYGIGAILLTLTLYGLRNRNGITVFAVSALIGAAFEFLCSWVQEVVFGTVSWDYSGSHLNLAGRTNLKYAVFWGLLGMIFIKHTYPFLSRYIERIPVKLGVWLTWICIVLMSVNILLSAAAVRRWTDRRLGQPPANAVEQSLDAWYPDDTMRAIYPHMKVV